MSDLPLAYELALIIAFVCLISWFMGRTLCKSKEHKERTAKKLLIKEKDHLESLLANKDDEIHQLSEQLGEAQKTIAALKHHDEINGDILMNLKQDHKETLNIVQQLTNYRTQFEELSKLYDDQSKQNVNLKETLGQAQNEIKQVTTHSNEQKSALEKYEEEQQNLKASSKNQDALIAKLRKQNANLQDVNEQQHEDIEVLNNKIEIYLESVNSTNTRISSMLETLPS